MLRSFLLFLLRVLCASSVFLFTECLSKEDFGPDFEIPDSNYSIYGQKGDKFVKETTSTSLDSDHPAIKVMQERAMRIARIVWSPRGPIPANNGSKLTKESYMGIPYSSVKELNKFVGQDVSFHTFIAAVNNPRSVLYTENVSMPPYKGTNCASYYGTVCSMTVNYALGLNRPYSSDAYDALSSFKRLKHQNFNALAPGDVIWRKSHVVLVTEVERNNKGDVVSLVILESNGMGTSLIRYSLKDFTDRWRGYDWILYRYMDLAGLDDNYDSFLWNEILLTEVNSDLCLSRGNWVSYRVGEEIVVNVFSSQFSMIELIKDGTVLRQAVVPDLSDFSFKGLAPGFYQIRLTNGDVFSNTVDFEVIDTRVTVAKSKEWLKISFSSVNAEPEFFIFCDEKGAPYYISDLSTIDKQRRYAFVKCEKSIRNMYVKVFFKGAFGRVSNTIVPLSN